MDEKSNSGEEDWRKPLIQHLMDKEPADPIQRTEMRRWAPRFTLQGNQLYKRLLDGILLRCLSTDEVNNVMNEVHASVCEGHQSSPKL